MKRVVVTGMAGISPIGQDWGTVRDNLRLQRGGIKIMPNFGEIDGLQTRLAGPVADFEIPPHYPRKKTRTMGRVSLLSTRATEMALQDAGLLDDPEIREGGMGVAYGSSTGSTEALDKFSRMVHNNSTKGVNATTYIQMMSHTTAVNVALFFGLAGRVIPTSSACTSGSQGVGYAYEAIRHGHQTMMVAGGAEELCVTEVAVFDVMYATSTANDRPDRTPRPFDRDRDGLVIGEGACTLVLEELEHAKARGATIHAEIVGFGTNSDGVHVTQPTPATMRRSMQLSLDQAGVDPADVGYVCAHATGTDHGDVAESQATYQVFGSDVPVSSLKSYMGHTLGANGSLESWITIKMMNDDWYAPTLHLEHVDERCADLDYIVGEGRVMQHEFAMNNNFAFGGINTSILFKRWA